MRIEAYTQVQQLYNTQKAGNTEKTAKKSFSDAVQISSMGKDMQVAKQAVASSPDVRTDLVASLKEKVQSGEYEVSADDFAQKLFEKYNSML